MASNIPIAGIVLRLPDGKVVLQRKDKDAPTAPRLLTLFGGHIEKNETPEMAIARELHEETSIRGDLELRPMHGFVLEENGLKLFHIFEATIADLSFQVFEGEGAEAYPLDSALERHDLAESARRALEGIKNG